MAGEKRHLKAVERPRTAEEAFLLNEKMLEDISATKAKIGQFMNEAGFPLYLGGPALLILACDVAGNTPLGLDLKAAIKKHLHIIFEEPTKQ